VIFLACPYCDEEFAVILQGSVATMGDGPFYVVNIGCEDTDKETT